MQRLLQRSMRWGCSVAVCYVQGAGCDTSAWSCAANLWGGCGGGVLTTRLPSPWNTSLLWPSEDARVLPTLRDWPADSEVTVCKGQQQ